jgi:hypothetical protein
MEAGSPPAERCEAQGLQPGTPQSPVSESHKTSSARSRAQDRMSSPTRAARDQATGRSRDGHENQQVQQGSSLKHRSEVSPSTPP